MAAADPSEYAVLLRDFANTIDVSEDVDVLRTQAELTAWCHEQGLLGRRSPATTDDLALARDLRGALREAFRANHDLAPVPALDRLARQLPLALGIREGRPRLYPVEKGVRGALTHLVVAAAEAGADGSWRRLKICAADDCAVAFYDASKNRSKTWCSMQVCGNRTKTRTYRARRSAEG